MARYIIEAPHTPEECLQSLDDVLAQGPDTLARYDFGCAAGDHSNHIAFTTVEAASAAAALGQVPAGISKRATVREVAKFTPEMIRSYHS